MLKKIRPGDWVVVCLVLCAAVLIYLPFRGHSDSSLTAVIRQNGEIIETISLSGLKDPITYTVNGDYTNIITAEDGRICVSSATCPRKTCVHTGWLTRAGQTAVCLENRMSITLESDAASDAADVVVK